MSAGLHQRLRDAAAALDGERVTLSTLADLHGPATQGTLLVLLAAPCMLPMPGVGSVLGLGLALMALAMWRGHGAAGLSQRVARFELSAAWARRVLELLARFYDLAGRMSRSRLGGLAESRPRSWIAAKTGLMAVLIILPIPFGNVLPALALMLLGLGLAFRDGVAVLLSTALAGTAVLYTAGLGVAAWVWGLAPLLRWLQP
ncbi:MAG: exopolysaccharide biosynthesis protein [Burkholderiaceae bacterium]|nr:exopolysaccharide biosynthesis protein [Burkholderiaceae bacterium]